MGDDIVANRTKSRGLQLTGESEIQRPCAPPDASENTTPRRTFVSLGSMSQLTVAPPPDSQAIDDEEAYDSAYLQQLSSPMGTDLMRRKAGHAKFKSAAGAPAAGAPAALTVRAPDDDDAAAVATDGATDVGADASAISSPMGTDLMRRKAAFGKKLEEDFNEADAASGLITSPVGTALMHRKAAFQSPDADAGLISSPVGTALMQRKAGFKRDTRLEEGGNGATGGHDIYGDFIISETLYGRRKSCAPLRATWLVMWPSASLLPTGRRPSRSWPASMPVATGAWPARAAAMPSRAPRHRRLRMATAASLSPLPSPCASSRLLSRAPVRPMLSPEMYTM